MKLIALQIKTTSNFQENLTHLKDLINLCEKDSQNNSYQKTKPFLLCHNAERNRKIGF